MIHLKVQGDKRKLICRSCQGDLMYILENVLMIWICHSINMNTRMWICGHAMFIEAFPKRELMSE
jgi:hypothetical protein